MLGLLGSGALAGAAAGSFLAIPDLAVPLFASAGAIAGAAAGLLGLLYALMGPGRRPGRSLRVRSMNDSLELEVLYPA